MHSSPVRPRRRIPSSASLDSLESASSYGSNVSDGSSRRDYRAVIKGACCAASAHCNAELQLRSCNAIDCSNAASAPAVETVYDLGTVTADLCT